MKFGLVEGIRTEATKGAKGTCPGCGSELIAKCGEQKVHHWAHKGTRACDQWWESETEWHRAWKNNFDVTMQEVIKIDPISGERHIADIYLPHKDLVIEFQHSPIDIQEIHAREKFYKRMIWVVDIPANKKRIELINEFFKEESIESTWQSSINLRRRNRIKEGDYAMEGEWELLEEEKREMSLYTSNYNTWSSHPDYFLMYWIRKQKRWERSAMPLFFDIGDDYLYMNIHTLKFVSYNVVKRFLKSQFIDRYKLSTL